MTSTGCLALRRRPWETLLRLAAQIAIGVLLGAPPVRALDTDRRLTQFMLDVWTARDGAPAGSIRRIEQTPDGYLWLATDSSGLIRFDGVRFVHDDALDRLVDRSDYSVFSVHTARDGALWVGTHWGLARLQDGRWQGPFSVGDAAGGIHETDAGELRFALGSRGFGWFEGGQPEVRALRADCLDAATTPGGVTWLASKDGLWRVTKTESVKLSVADGLAHETVNAVSAARDGGLWIATRAGVNLMRGGRIVATFTTRDGLPSNDTSAIYEDGRGCVWIGTTSSGLGRLCPGHPMRRFSSVYGLPSDSVTAFFEDREGSLWVGTSGGLARFKAGSFVPYGEREGLPHSKATSVLESRDGALWVWSDGGGLAEIRGDRVRTLRMRDGLVSDFGGPLFESRDGSLWIGHDPGISRLKDGRITAYRDIAPGASYVSAFTEDAQGLILYAIGPGLCRFRDGRATPYRLPNGETLDLAMVWAMHWDREGALWLCTSTGAVTVRGNEVRQVWSLPGEFSVAAAIHEDAEGALWLSTWDGIIRFAGGRMARFGPEQGLPQRRIHHILEDRAGHLWVAGSKGIYRVRKQALEDVAAFRSRQVTPEVFGVADGLRSPEATSGAEPSACATRSGRLWFATTAGVASVDPERLTRNPLPPPVKIEAALLDGQVTPVTSQLKVPAGTGRLELSYNGLSLLAPQRVRFRYRLLGLEREWVDAGTRRTAYYSSLPPGRFTFLVTACNNDGVWNEQGAALATRCTHSGTSASGSGWVRWASWRWAPPRRFASASASSARGSASWSGASLSAPASSGTKWPSTSAPRRSWRRPSSGWRTSTARGACSSRTSPTSSGTRWRWCWRRSRGCSRSFKGVRSSWRSSACTAT
jgi:ligand-binding sensor domain-containing protein